MKDYNTLKFVSQSLRTNQVNSNYSTTGGYNIIVFVSQSLRTNQVNSNAANDVSSQMSSAVTSQSLRTNQVNSNMNLIYIMIMNPKKFLSQSLRTNQVNSNKRV